MKHTAIILLFLQLFLSCKGQGNKTAAPIYTQRLEYRLTGPVQEVTSYICKAEKGSIPTDTTHHVGKITMTFDSAGNAIEMNRAWDFGSMGNSKSNSRFFGKGKNISSKETVQFNGGDPEEFTYTYQWKDGYNYTIISPEDSSYTTEITLDKNYQLIRNVFKKGDTIQLTEEWGTTYKNNKLHEISTKRIHKEDDGTEDNYQLQVVQQSDRHGNPTIIYVYQDSSKQKVDHVIYKYYKYHETKK